MSPRIDFPGRPIFIQLSPERQRGGRARGERRRRPRLGRREGAPRALHGSLLPRHVQVCRQFNSVNIIWVDLGGF